LTQVQQLRPHEWKYYKKKRVRIVGQNMLNQKMFGQKNNCWETQNKAQQEMFGQYCVQKMKNVRKIIAKETNLA
jgi:hypothetical protein